MKSIPKPAIARSYRPARASGSLAKVTEGKTRIARQRAFDDGADMDWDATEWDIDPVDFDYEAGDDEDEAPGSDWLADRDLALEIAQRALQR